MPWICCTKKRSKREDQYKVKENEMGSTSTQVQFSWDKRDNSNVSRLMVKEVSDSVELRKDFKQEPVMIDNCKDSVIIVLGNLTAANIDDCSDCLIVLGPCNGSVFIRDCQNVTVMVICQQLRTRDCHGLKLAVRSMSEPIIETSDEVKIYPLMYFYDSLKAELLASEIRPFYNKAVSVHDFTPENGKIHYEVCKNLLELKEKEIAALHTHGIKHSARLTLFPLPTSFGCSTTLSYMGKTVEFSNVYYEECKQRLLDDIEVNRNIMVGCTYEVDLLENNYDELNLPLGGYARLTIVGCVGDEQEFRKILRRHPLYKLIDPDKASSFVAAMRSTGIIRSEEEEKE